jgi:LysM repeat protein
VSSLSNHLREPGSHGRLPFHPSCPVCRDERLSGSLAGDAILGQRTRAGLLAAALALSSLGLPVSALAQSDPTSPPAAPAPDGTLDRVDSDDGTQPDNPAAEDDAPIGGENLIEPDPDDLREEPDATPLSELPPEQPGEEVDVAPEAEPQPETAPAPVAPPVAVTPTPQPVPAPATPLPTPPVLPTTPPTTGELVERPEGETAGGKTRQVLLDVEPNPRAVREGSQGSLGTAEPHSPAAPLDEQAAALASPPVPATAPAAATSSGAATVPVSQPSSAPPGEIDGDTYTVRPGDSLWSIARRLLGPDASAGRIAREVNRLWELNRERIATGDPDLLMVGTKLRLR